MMSDTIKYIGVDDLDIDLFESQYVSVLMILTSTCLRVSMWCLRA